MKQILTIAIILSSLMLCLQSCIQDDCTNEFTFIEYTPVYMTETELRQDIIAEAPRALQKPGKIYFYEDYIFLNESRKGIHIINNSDPSNPINEAFISIPCNMDIAVKEKIMYADNCIDLLAIDISDLSNPVLKNRTENVFPAPNFDPQQGYLVYNEEEWVTEIRDCNDRWNNFFLEDGLINTSNAQSSSPPRSGGIASNSTVGQGGSLARFTIAGDFLYTVGENNLLVFNIQNASYPSLGIQVNLGWGIETLYPYNNHLFIGSQTGMFIYDIEDGANPEKRGSFNHARACDPVVVKDNYAYVTLRGGTPCGGLNNQLDVIDVTNVYNPNLLRSYEMDGPYGLAITENDVLYVCDGESGLRVYNATDPLKLDQVHREKRLSTYDVIALKNDVIMVIGPDGLYQYDISDKKKLKELSVISVENR